MGSADSDRNELRQDLPSSESPADMMREGTTLKRQWMVADGVVKRRIGRY
jgi:hypothetical protein